MQQCGFYVAEKGQCTHRMKITQSIRLKKKNLVGVVISIVGLSYRKKVMKEMKLTPKLTDSVTESKLLALLTARQANESERGGGEVRKMALFRKPADWKDGRLTPQNNHLIGAWMPCPFIDQRERSNKELKSKGRTEQERQWESKVKSSSVLQNICKGMASFWKRVCYCLLFTGGHELNKGLKFTVKHFHFSLSCIGEGNGNPLQCSYLENPRDGGA